MVAVLTLAFDISNFTAIPTLTQLQGLWNAGYRRVIVGVSYGDKARAQMLACHQFGFEVQAYAFLEWGNLVPPLARAYKAIAGIPVTRMWLDLEEHGAGCPPETLVALTKQAIDYARDWRPDLPLGIYSAAWWWNTNMQGVYETFNLPLWFANYTKFHYDVAEHLFGGWHEDDVDMWQWANGGTGQALFDINADLSICYVRNDDMDASQVNTLISQYVDPKVGALLGNQASLGSDIVKHGAQIGELARALARHIQEGGAAADPALAARITELEAQQADLVARVRAAGAALDANP